MGKLRSRSSWWIQLKRLEYRGYDSAGVATLEDGQFARRRAEGKLRNLESRLEARSAAGTSGIGHTRWATHGRPSEDNAHPHATNRVAVVHNGIIENFRPLRDELEEARRAFESETDTEVVAHLVTVSCRREGARRGRRCDARSDSGAFSLGFLFTAKRI